MKLFGLTGGIGAGKSTAATFLARRGLPVIDTDTLARELVEPGQPALAEVTAAFGRELLDDRGQLRRAALAQIVFASPEKLKRLEAILHPRIRERWLAQAEAWRREGRAAGVVVIPLLFETEAKSQFDFILCTACASATQLERLRQRGWSDVQIQQRLAAQWPMEKKMAASTHVLWTEGDVAIHQQQIEKILSTHLPAL